MDCSLHCLRSPLVATELKCSKVILQCIACSFTKHVMKLVSWREKTPTTRVETQPLPLPLAGERGLPANSGPSCPILSLLGLGLSPLADEPAVYPP